MSSIWKSRLFGYAILRHDGSHETGDVTQHIAVVKVVQTADRAIEETDRLNALNSSKGCRYFFQYVRLEAEDDSPWPEIAKGD